MGGNMYNIPAHLVDKLLQILRKRLLPQLPKNAVTFLNTFKATYNIKVMICLSGNSEWSQWMYRSKCT